MGKHEIVTFPPPIGPLIEGRAEVHRTDSGTSLWSEYTATAYLYAKGAGAPKPENRVEACYGNRVHAAVWAKGARAGMRGDTRACPYVGGRSGLGTIGQRGHRNAWNAGYDAAHQLVADVLSDAGRAPEVGR